MTKNETSIAGALPSPLKLLHLGSGFRPLRRGGLVAYVEDLMDEQVRQGHDVAYFFAGRYYPFGGKPRVKRWRRRGIAMFEVINSPLIDHGRQPHVELAEPRIEAMLEQIIDDLQPDVVHVQELAGLPSSVLEVARRADVPVVLTLQDYFPLCSTFKLLDVHGKVCLRREIGEDCVATIAADSRRPGLMVEVTLRHDLQAQWWSQHLSIDQREALIMRVHRWSLRATQFRTRHRPDDLIDQPTAFQHRRDVNVQRLSQADLLIAMSERVAEIYEQLGVEPHRLVTMQLTLGHIENLRPRHHRGGSPVTFATLGGGESIAKGGFLLLEAVASLSHAVGTQAFRLIIFGYVDEDVAEVARRTDCVEVHGPYAPDELNELLEDVDVGIMPSIWEEAYGYAGMEFLAKAIPVLGNAIGGITEYVRDGETGWVNESCSADGLATIMEKIIERPEQISELNINLRSTHDSIVLPFGRHAAGTEAMYREEIAAKRLRSRPHR